MKRFIGIMLVGLVACALAACLVPAMAVADGYQYAGRWGSGGTGNGQFDGIGGIAADGLGTVYVSDVGNKRIQKFSASGAYSAQWGTLDSRIDGLAVDLSGNVYAADYWGARILKFSSSGALLAQFATKIAGDFDSEPHSIAVDSAGNLWVTDSGDHLVKKFSSSGAYLGLLGSAGSEPGQFDFPVGVAVDSSDNVYVVDCFKYNIQKFSSGGAYLGGRVTVASGDANLLRPVHVAVDGAGATYVADTFVGTLFNDGSVKKFDSSFVLQTRIGVYAGSAPLDGTFCSVWGVAVGPSGKVYIADGAVNRVTIFSPTSVTPAPTVGGFTPTSGPVGTSVTISGTGFGGATAVSFHGSAADFSVKSATRITATVPADATSGVIAVTTPGGSASSAASFTVTTSDVTPTVTLALGGLTRGALKLGKRVTAKGLVTPGSLAGSAVGLTVQKKQGATWLTTRTTAATISPAGAYSWQYEPAKKGSYRLQATITGSATQASATTPWRAFKVT
jgi:hypothetical protein